jgi:hypothetical protein
MENILMIKHNIKNIYENYVTNKCLILVEINAIKSLINMNFYLDKCG